MRKAKHFLNTLKGSMPGPGNYDPAKKLKETPAFSFSKGMTRNESLSGVGPGSYNTDVNKGGAFSNGVRF